MEDTVTTYSKIASLYDGFIEDELSPNTIAEMPHTLGLIGDASNKSVLDLCCGTGRYAMCLAAQGASVVGVDITPDLIERARQKAAKNNLDIDYSIVDVSSGSFGQEKSFDMVVCGMSIHYIKDIYSLFERVAHVLKKNGIFVISTNHPIRDCGDFIFDEQGNMGRTIFNYFSDEQRRKYWKTFSDTTGVHLETHVFSHTIAAVSDALSKAGFVIEKILEPQPSDDIKEKDPERYQKMMCCPQFILYRARKV